MSEELYPLTIANSWFDGDLHTHLLIAPNEQPVARIKFDGVHDKSEGIWTEVTVEYLFQGTDEEPIIEFENINLLSNTWMNKNGMLEQITYRDQTFAWQEGIRSVVRASIRQHRTAASSHEFLTRADPDKEETPFLIEPLVSSTGLTLWYSPPNAGKSMNALAVAVSVATGYPVFGHVPTKVGTVIYVDAEDDIIAHRIRLNAILKEIGWDGDDPPIIYFSMKGRFRDAVRPLKSLIREHEAALVIVDSIGQVRNADASDGGATIVLMNQLNSLPVPVLGIDHVTKEDNRSIARGRVDSPDAVMAIGSQFSTASARLGWFFQHMTTSTAMHVKFNIHNTKHNHVAKQDTMSLDIKFVNNDRGLMTNLKFITWGSQMHYEVTNERNEEAALVIHYRADRPLGTTELARMCGVVRSTLASIHRKSPYWAQVAGSTQYRLTEMGIVQATALISLEEA